MKQILWVFGVLGYAGSVWSAAPGTANPKPIKSEDLLIRSGVSVEEVIASPEMDPMYRIADTTIKITTKITGACTKQFVADTELRNSIASVLTFSGLQTNRGHIQPACFNVLEYNWSPWPRGPFKSGLVQPVELVVHSGERPGWDQQGQVVLAKDYLVSGELQMNYGSGPNSRGKVVTYSKIQVSKKDRRLTSADYIPLFSDWVQIAYTDLVFQSATAPFRISMAYYNAEINQIALYVVVNGPTTGHTTEGNLRADVKALVFAKLKGQQFPFPAPGPVQVAIENTEELRKLPVLK